MKKIILLTLSMMLIWLPFAGCSKVEENSPKAVSNKKEEIVEIQVPDLTGMTIAKASQEIINKKLGIGEITEDYSLSTSKGNVIEQEPKAGEKRKESDKIALLISKGPKEITHEQGLEIIKDSINGDYVFDKVSNIGTKQFYWYKDSDENAEGDSVVCVEVQTGQVFYYYGDGTLHDLNDKIVSTKKADWHLQQEAKDNANTVKEDTIKGNGIVYKLNSVKYSQGANYSYIYITCNNISKKYYQGLLSIEFYDANSKVIGSGYGGLTGILKPGGIQNIEMYTPGNMKNFSSFKIIENLYDATYSAELGEKILDYYTPK